MNLEWQKIREEKPVKVGFRSIIKKNFEMPDGAVEEYYIKNEAPSVCILALTADNKIILAKQFRPGPGKVLFELPGGVIEKHEEPIEAAKRELLEETSYAGDLVLINESYKCGYSTTKSINFIATNCKKIAEQKLDKTEFIEVVIFQLDEFKNHLHSGQLTDVATAFYGLDYLGLL